ncbi:MAG: SUF system NifU family Fe-S cluster assembly protein [Alphaproteobacteria bacterium RIFOXYD12_FULL_60_8]|nr:MAG: SUF system NifU family Fe-S cluster assembly protein [Alphaproteobacteria bacterium RIFOXYD12_FULL_60_8]
MMDELRDLYQEVILDHGRNPRNFRHPEDANRHAHGANPMCGDQLVVYLKLGATGLVEDVAFQGKGCAISMASASLMTEIVVGKTEAQAHALFHAFHQLVSQDAPPEVPAELEEDFDRLQALAGVREFPVRVKCATLAWHTLEAAVNGEDEISTE